MVGTEVPNMLEIVKLNVFGKIYSYYISIFSHLSQLFQPSPPTLPGSLAVFKGVGEGGGAGGKGEIGGRKG